MVVSPSPTPADGLSIYQSVVRRAIEVFMALIALYEPDIRSERDWADITVSESQTQLDGLRQRLTIPQFASVYTTTLASTLGHYADVHRGDYKMFMPNPDKRQQVVRLHATLRALADELAPVSITLLQQERASRP